jgi:hypothetical protein
MYHQGKYEYWRLQYRTKEMQKIKELMQWHKINEKVLYEKFEKLGKYDWGEKILIEKIQKYVRDSNQQVENVYDWMKKYSKILDDNIRDDENKFNSNWCMKLGNCDAS